MLLGFFLAACFIFSIDCLSSYLTNGPSISTKSHHDNIVFLDLPFMQHGKMKSTSTLSLKFIKFSSTWVAIAYPTPWHIDSGRRANLWIFPGSADVENLSLKASSSDVFILSEEIGHLRIKMQVIFSCSPHWLLVVDLATPILPYDSSLAWNTQTDKIGDSNRTRWHRISKAKSWDFVSL